VEFGEEFAHLELQLDASTGSLFAYALDGEAENSVRLAQHTIEIEVRPPSAPPFTVKLEAYASALTGESVGDTSQFSGKADALKGQPQFDGIVKAVKLKGQEFKDVAFNYPKGNEDDRAAPSAVGAPESSPSRK
jgi:hypothetical protein